MPKSHNSLQKSRLLSWCWNFRAHKLFRLFLNHKWTLTTRGIQMFQCYIQPIQEKVSLSPEKHCSSSPSSTKCTLFSLNTSQTEVHAACWKSPHYFRGDLRMNLILGKAWCTNYPDLAAVVPVNWHSTSSNLRVIARSLELIKYRIRKLTLINENNLSLNLYIFWTGVHKHFDMRMTMTLCTG